MNAVGFELAGQRFAVTLDYASRTLQLAEGNGAVASGGAEVEIRLDLVPD